MDAARIWKPIGVLAAASVTIGVVFALAALLVGNQQVAGKPAAVADQMLVKHEPSVLTKARTECSPGAGSMGSLTEDHDGQVTLVIDGAGVDDTGAESPTEELAAVACVLQRISAPADVTARMDQTRALDGMQDASWGEYKASWTYHPDSGLNLILTEK